MSKQMYEAYFFNFVSSISRPLLEDLAAASVNSNAISQVMKLFDQYQDFVCLEPYLFTLNDAHSYQRLNDQHATDAEMQGYIDHIVNALFCVLVTLGVVPIIRSSKGGAAGLIAEKLDSRVRDVLINSRSNLFTTDSSTITLRRPGLCARLARDDVSLMDVSR